MGRYFKKCRFDRFVTLSFFFLFYNMPIFPSLSALRIINKLRDRCEGKAFLRLNLRLDAQIGARRFARVVDVDSSTIFV